jgi:hypothetical protein
MSQGRSAASTARTLGTGVGRVLRAGRALPYERRLAAGAAIGLFVTLFLPWYHETVVAASGSKAGSASASVTGWGAFSFVEAAVLLVAVGVLTLLFQRAEGKAFHLPGGDGTVIMVAGGWTFVLVVWRIFDKQSVNVHGPGASISGIEWGIFVALAVAAGLTYTGRLIRAAHRPEPPLPGEAATDEPAAPSPSGAPPAWEFDDAAPDASAPTRTAVVADAPPTDATQRLAGRRIRRGTGDEEAPTKRRPAAGTTSPAPPPAPRGAEKPARPVGWLTARPEGHPGPDERPTGETTGWSYDEHLREDAAPPRRSTRLWDHDLFDEDDPPQGRRGERDDDYDDPPPRRRRRPDGDR